MKVFIADLADLLRRRRFSLRLMSLMDDFRFANLASDLPLEQ
jgi:hypothetical protein